MDLMTDIETMGTDKDAAILSIGAVMFDPLTGRLGEQLRVNIDPVSNERFGRKIDMATVLWWLQQSDEARAALVNRDGVRHLSVALHVLFDFVQSNEPNHLWANSPDFDYVILERATIASGSLWPMKFYKYRCVRTVRTLAAQHAAERGAELPVPVRDGEAHDALADAIWQAQLVQACYRELQL